MNYTATQEQMGQLISIYNALCSINTKGDDTITMSNCLQAFKAVIESMAQPTVEEEEIEE